MGAKMYTEHKPFREEYLIALDFLPNGYPMDSTPAHKRLPIIQALGKEKFVLLELVAKKDTFVQPYEELYAGDGKRDKVHHILGRLSMDKLTHTAKAELAHVIEGVVDKKEKDFVNFFNKAQPLSTRMHSLELIPGFGKKHMQQIIELREEKPFENFEDLKARVKLIPDPNKAIVKRILMEMEGNEKHNLFVERQ
jgi:putative nucleotide binding protein